MTTTLNVVGWYWIHRSWVSNHSPSLLWPDHPQNEANSDVWWQRRQYFLLPAFIHQTTWHLAGYPELPSYTFAPDLLSHYLTSLNADYHASQMTSKLWSHQLTGDRDGIRHGYFSGDGRGVGDELAVVWYTVIVVIVGGAADPWQDLKKGDGFWGR